MKKTSVTALFCLMMCSITLSTMAQGQSGTETGPRPENEMYVVLQDAGFIKTLNQKARTFKPKEAEIQLALKVFKEAVVNHNNREMVKAVAAEMLNIIQQESFYKQLIPYRIGKEKFIYFNCLCSPHGEEWKNKVIEVDGGYRCYFQVIVNLSKKTSDGIFFNGIL